jgi:uncharacterized membrane protein
MLISNLFVRHKVPPPRFAPALFLSLLAVFVLLGNTKPVVGLVGIGCTVIVAAVLIELNSDRIWETYRKTYKKESGLKRKWTEPNRLYYNLNVYFLWPFVFCLGLLCLYAAYVTA